MITWYLHDTRACRRSKQRSKIRNRRSFCFLSIFFQFPHRFIFNYMFYFIHNVLGGKTFRKRINNIGNEIAKRLWKSRRNISSSRRRVGRLLVLSIVVFEIKMATERGFQYFRIKRYDHRFANVLWRHPGENAWNVTNYENSVNNMYNTSVPVLCTRPASNARHGRIFTRPKL